MQHTVPKKASLHKQQVFHSRHKNGLNLFDIGVSPKFNSSIFQSYNNTKRSDDQYLLKSPKGNYFDVVIGLEVHAQVKSNSKLFSSASTKFGTSPNSQIQLMDAAVPGVLPTINKTCIDQAIKTSIALNGEIQPKSRFDRKHYHYSDLPQGYQITQQFMPIMKNGRLNIEIPNGKEIQIPIERIQLEQDSGRNLHDQDPNLTLVDLNRSGIALLEIISAPSLRSPTEAAEYVKALQFLLRHINVSDGNMEEGSLRCDVNVSVKPHGSIENGTRCEIKNVSSIKFIAKAIEYEASRHIDLIENGETISQDTRMFDASRGTTILMRSKEDAPDYRFFPDPDLPLLYLDQSWISNIENNMPELPGETRKRLMEDYDLSQYMANVLLFEPGACHLFEDTVKILGQKINPTTVANWITIELYALLRASNKQAIHSPVNSEQLASLVDAVESKLISALVAKDILAEMFGGDNRKASIIAQDKGVLQENDESKLKTVIEQVMKDNPDEVSRYRSGDKRLKRFFVGKVMQASRGKANPPLVSKLLQEML